VSERVYLGLVQDLSGLLEAARRSSARAVNAVMTATYWEVGRRIVEFEQGGEERAAYGGELLEKLAGDLSPRFGRGFSPRNLLNMRKFYGTFPIRSIPQTLSAEFESVSPPLKIRQTVSGESSSDPPPVGIFQTASEISTQPATPPSFPLPPGARP
jgi:DUF1016 N-terminal domain